MDTTFLEEYYILEEFGLSSKVSSLAKSLTKDKALNLLNKLKNFAKTDNLKRLKSEISHIPYMHTDKVKEICAKLSPHFDSSYDLSKKVLSNSLPNLNNKLVDALSTGIAIKSTYKNDNPSKTTKENIKKSVDLIRKSTPGTEVDYTEIGYGIVIMVIIDIILFSYAYYTPAIIVVILLLMLIRWLIEEA